MEEQRGRHGTSQIRPAMATAAASTAEGGDGGGGGGEAAIETVLMKVREGRAVNSNSRSKKVVKFAATPVVLKKRVEEEPRMDLVYRLYSRWFSRASKVGLSLPVQPPRVCVCVCVTCDPTVSLAFAVCPSSA